MRLQLMQIKGADGYSPEMIRDEVERGGRLVIYVYCISIFVMTFKRGTSVHFLRAGQSPVARGLPFTFVTLLFGWWGFPWGPIYSIECLHKNLRGGIDVTDEVLANILPSPTPPPIYSPESSADGGTSSGGYHNSPSHASSRAPLPPRKPAFTLTPRLIALGAAAVVALAFTIFAASSYHAGQHLTTAVVNGLPTRTAFQINDKTIVVAPHGYQLIEIPEGDIHVGPAAGQPAQTLHVETDFWTRLFSPKIAVINPDRLALIESRNVIYRATNSTIDYSHLIDWKVLTNESLFVLPEPDYAFVTPPENHEISRGADYAQKTRVGVADVINIDQRLDVVRENNGPSAARIYATHLAAALPDVVDVPQAVITYLEPKDALAVIEPRLDDRPLRVEWHRVYQSAAEVISPEIDLPARYAELAAKNPDDGAALYLLARLNNDPNESRTAYNGALAAAQPCAYAHVGLAYLDGSNAHFQAALDHYNAALAAGVSTDSIIKARRQMLVALHRHEELLKDIAERRAADPNDLLLMVEELRATATAPDATAASIDALMNRYIARGERNALPGEKDVIHAFFDCQLAYALGDEARFARSSEVLKGPRASFEAAIARRDHAAAKLALKDQANIPSAYYLELYLVAEQQRDQSSADFYWANAVEAFGREGKSGRRLAEHLKSGARLNLDLICYANLPTVTRPLLFTCLGLRDHDNRPKLFAWAKLHNYSHEFPSLLIDSVLRTTQQKMDMLF